MSHVIDTSINSGILKFTFTDSDGDVFASFKMNPTDVRLLDRCKEISQWFSDVKESMANCSTAEELAKLNSDLEDKICDLLGYDARQSLFGFMSATTILPDGDIFAVKVMDKIVATVEPEIEKRKQAMQKAAAKYTAKYTK